MYQYMRTVEPVHKSPVGFWILTRYADCRQVLVDANWSHDADAILEPNRGADEPSDPTVRLLRASILFSDGPHHREHLRPLEAAIRKAMKKTEPLATRVAADLVTLMREKRDKLDLVQDFASPLSLVTIGDLLGVPPADRVSVQRWGLDLSSGLDPMVRPVGVLKAGAASAAMVEYLLDRIDSAGSGSGALDELAALPRKLRTWELIADLAVLIITGLEVTTAFIANSALALLRNPEQRRLLAGRPELIGRAVEELLRYDGPVHLTARAAIADVDVGGKTIAAGEQAIALLGAANRDPARFKDPDTLDITREDNEHLAFGSGMHQCFAAPLGRLIGAAAVAKLARLEIEPAAEPVWLDTISLRGLRHLPVRLSS